MRKLVLALVVVVTALVGCQKRPAVAERQHVYHTYYGDIDVDTMRAITETDSTVWYLVKTVEKDSFNWDGVWKYQKGPIKYLYCPANDKYEMEFPDNQGNWTLHEFDPYHQYDWLK